MVLSRACCRLKELLYELMGRRNLINAPGTQAACHKEGHETWAVGAMR